ncbi:hypothetical protein [Zavarzinia compransoris]|uniref:Uncharacterized protein n=1 Tax=Zavarzinia compransoris TaxID=1264899 RepID=A0A317E4L0_9PROT|nr:hypothetical protein [Zavarzinia compransoris]PWR21987.1 hypothetical protein DKG75_08385 [Zavarzinia compransoris]TDP47275.1 hypothetical protein DES42_103447 [Zavarzinia compransoris]
MIGQHQGDVTGGPQAAAPPDEDTVGRRCRELADMLNLAAPVPVDVLEAAVRDEAYAQRLLATRRNPRALDFLLKHPPKAAGRSNGELVRAAALAFLRWGKVGFATVDGETLARRRDACLACPHLADPPDSTLYRLAAARDSRKICGSCGCVVWSKTRLPTEACPQAHPDDPRLNRWGEPRRAAAGAASDPKSIPT